MRDAASSCETKRIMTKHYPLEHQRALKAVLDHLDEYRTVYWPAR
jgi:hypothetical protein